MEYHLLTYSLLFLPAVIVLYRFFPAKLRPYLMLAAGYTFFFMVSEWLILFFVLANAVAYFGAHAITEFDKRSSLPRKQKNSRKKLILFAGILIPLGLLVVFKYLRAFGVTLIAPIGISYYTLQIISYLTDVYRGLIKPEKNPMKLLLYLSFFPGIMEGPISRYSDIAEDLYQARDISYHNLAYGYQRIVWGLFKKMVVADRLGPVVANVFSNPQKFVGSSMAFAAVCFTMQLYAEFSGCMDIVIGSGEIFGIKLPENFRQPFFAENAGDFWRRWHITLGAWLKDYIFFPVSLSKPLKNLSKKSKKTLGMGFARMMPVTVALFCVWLSNGIWHGAGPTYLFYGMYYFVLIFIETLFEGTRKAWEAKHQNLKVPVFIFKEIKLAFIVVIGEMFFRAPSISQGFYMLKNIFTNFRPGAFFDANIGINPYDILMAFAGSCLIFIIDIIHEKNISIRDFIAKKNIAVRWAFWYAAILLVILFGAYGVGYSAIDMLYAAY